MKTKRHWVRRRPVAMLMLLIVLGVLYVGAVFVANRFRSAPVSEAATIHRSGAAELPVLARDGAIRVMTWNVGYAGMGEESDFIADGGVQSRCLSKGIVDKNLAGIVATLREHPVDVYMIEEAAGPSWFNHGTDVLGRLAETLDGCAWTYGDDFATRLLPPPWRTSIGNAIFSRYRIAEASRRALPLEPTYIAGTFRKLYRAHAARLPIDGTERSLTLVSIHVAAFDADAKVRLEQLRSVIGFAQEEHARGRAVVVGGDFNLRLARTEFPHQTEARHLFWVHDWPEGLTPEGWTLVADPEKPTSRTDYQPYVAGENYTCIIDGFLCSPDIEVRSIRTLDLGFKHSDHQPVIMEMRLREKDGEAPASR